MFGITPFAKVSFAAIGVAFAVATTENVGVADSQVFNAQYAESITESISQIFDVQSEQDNFFEGIVETLTSADTEAASIQFQFSIAEPTTSAESESISAQFKETIVEAWGQTPYSVPQQPSISAFAMAGSPFAGSFNTVGFLENPSYVVQVNLLDSITENSNQLDTPTITAQYPLSVAENTTVLDTPTITAQFLESLNENFGIADFSTQTSAFIESLTEATTIAEIDTIVAGFIESIVEPTTLNNSQSITAQFVEIIAEAITVADSSTQQSNFLNSIVETFIILDSQFVAGWIKINDNQNAGWGYRNQIINEIGGFATCTFGGVPFAGYLSFSGIVPNPILDQNTPNWAGISNNQTTNWVLINNTQ
jgi:hypothetical protein